MKLKWFALATVIAMVLAACGGDGGEEAAPEEAAPAEEEPIIIGFAIGQTGFLESYDVPPAEAAEIAIEEINAEGGILGRPVETIYGDTKSEPELGATVALELIDKGADILIVTGDFDFGGPAARVANDRGVLAISPFAASPKFGPQVLGPRTFTMATAANTQGLAMAEFGYEELGFRTAYLLLDDSIDFEIQLAKGFEERWTELAGEEALLGKDRFNQEDPSIASQVTRIKSLPQQPDFVYLASYPPGGATALRQIRAAGIDVPILAGEDFDGTYWQEAVPNTGTVYYTMYGSIFGDDPEAKVNELVAAYMERTGEEPSTGHMLTGYATLQAIVRAAEIAGSLDGDALAKALETFQNEPLLVGPTTFSSEFHIQLTRSVRIMKIEDGEHSFEQIWEPSKAPEVEV